jgi:hypothetical protein
VIVTPKFPVGVLPVVDEVVPASGPLAVGTVAVFIDAVEPENVADAA